MKNKNRKFDEFDHFANEYREIHNKNIKISGLDSDYFSDHKIKILKENEKTDAIDLLDFGCGDGNSAEFFNKYFKNSSYKGIDISTESINIAKTKEFINTEFQFFDGENIPFNDNSMDVIFTACVFHHINFKLHQNLFLEIYRVLKPGGRFYIFEHNPWNPVTRHMVNTCPFDKDAVLLSHKYTQKMFKQAKFNKIETNFILFFPRHNFFKIFLQLEPKLKKIPFGGQYYIKGIK